MFSNVTVFTLRDGVAVDAVREWAEWALATFKQEAGFRGLLLLGDEEGNGGQIVTLWESKEAMAAVIAGAGRQERFGALLRLVQPTQRPHHVLFHALL